MEIFGYSEVRKQTQEFTLLFGQVPKACKTKNAIGLVHNIHNSHSPSALREKRNPGKWKWQCLLLVTIVERKNKYERTNQLQSTCCSYY